jgi:hypothetical protein
MVPRLKQSGQAALEYILLLVLIVAICVGLGSKLYQPLKQWTDFYMGSYTVCMLDSGKLPAIAGGEPTDCGTPPNMGSGGTAGLSANQSSSSSTSAQNSNDSAASNAQKQAEASAESRAAAAARRKKPGQFGSSGRGGSSDSGSSSRNIGAEAPPEDNVTAVGSLDSNRDLLRSRRRTLAQAQRPIKAKGVRGFLAEEQEKLERREERITRIAPEAGGSSARARKLPFKPPAPRTPATTDEDGVHMGFGGLFRIALIIMIIVAVVYVVGSQLNTISKSSDK